MSLDIMDYSRLGDINRGIQRLTRTVQAQGSGATVPVETYNQLFVSYEQARAQLDEASKDAEHWERECRKMTRNKDEWVAYAREQRSRAEAAEAELDRLRTYHQISAEAVD